MESCRDSLQDTSKQVKTQIQKGANPETAAKNGHERTCDYLDILDRRINIQQRALKCQSKALSHMLQREHYGKLRPHQKRGRNVPFTTPFGRYRRQQQRSSPFAPTPLFHSQLVKDGRSFSSKKGTPQKHSGLQALIKSAHFWPHPQPKIRRLLQEMPLRGTIHKQ